MILDKLTLVAALSAWLTTPEEMWRDSAPSDGQGPDVTGARRLWREKGFTTQTGWDGMRRTPYSYSKEIKGVHEDPGKHFCP